MLYGQEVLQRIVANSRVMPDKTAVIASDFAVSVEEKDSDSY